MKFSFSSAAASLTSLLSAAPKHPHDRGTPAETLAPFLSGSEPVPKMIFLNSRRAAAGITFLASALGMADADRDELLTAAGHSLLKQNDLAIGLISECRARKPSATAGAMPLVRPTLPTPARPAAAVIQHVPQAAAPMAPTAPPALSTDALRRLHGEIFGRGESDAIAMEIAQTRRGELRTRLLQDFHDAALAVPGAELEQLALCDKLGEPTNGRGAAKATHDARQRRIFALAKQSQQPVRTATPTASGLRGKSRIAAAIRAEMNLPQ